MIRDHCCNAVQTLRTQISREKCYIQARNFKINNNDTNLYKNNTSYSSFTLLDYLQCTSSQTSMGWTGTQEVSIQARSYGCC